MSMCVPGGSPAAGDGPDHTEDEAEQEKPPSEQSPPFQTREVEDAQPAQLDERTDDAQAGAGRGTLVHELTVASASIGHQGPCGARPAGYTPLAKYLYAYIGT